MKKIILYLILYSTCSSLESFPQPWSAQHNVLRTTHAFGSTMLARVPRYLIQHPKTSLLCGFALGCAAYMWFTNQALKREIVTLKQDMQDIRQQLELRAHCDIMLERFYALDSEMKKITETVKQEIKELRK